MGYRDGGDNGARHDDVDAPTRMDFTEMESVIMGRLAEQDARITALESELYEVAQDMRVSAAAFVSSLDRLIRATDTSKSR